MSRPDLWLLQYYYPHSQVKRPGKNVIKSARENHISGKEDRQEEDLVKCLVGYSESIPDVDFQDLSRM